MTLENYKDGAPDTDMNNSSSDTKSSIDSVTEEFTNMAVLNDDNDKTTLSVCANCGKGEEESNSLKFCGACKLVKYCSAACQKEHRPMHKKACKKRVAELREEQLFKEVEPEECPICMIPMPQDDMLPSVFILCCGKMICAGCHYGMFKGGGSNIICPYCRIPAASTGEERIKRLKVLMDKGNAQAFHQLGGYYDQGLHGMPQDRTKARELWVRSGELGCSQAYYNLGIHYQNAMGVERDDKKAKHYYELAAMMGNTYGRYNLGCCDKQSGNFDRAFKHFVIAAKAGYKCLEAVKLGFEAGIVTKDEYANTLRAYQKSINEMKSDMRDQAAKTN